MTVKLKNNVVGYLATQISTTDTGLALNSGNGANFPVLGFGEYFYATLVSAGGTIEIVKVTARSGDALTVLRAQEGTTAAGFASGSRVELRVTAQSVLDAITDATAATVLVNPYGQQFTCTEGQTAFTLTTNPGSLYNLDVSLNGSTLVAGTDYTWVGTTLTLEDGAHAGDVLFARYTAATSVASIANGSVTDASVATGSVLASLIAAGPGAPYAHTYTATAGQTAFTLTKNPGSINNIQVVVDGAQLTPGVDFTWSGVTVTMTAPLFADNHVLIRYSSSDAVATVPTGGVTDASVATGSILYNSVIAVNVKHFGAVGDGVTDDTAAIQAAINSLPLNTADVGVLTPKGFAQGGQIYFPRGRYKITSTITMQRGLHICGEAREASQVISFTAGAVFKYADAGRYVQDEILVENLSIWQDSSVVANTGAGIEVFLGPASVESVGVILRNIYIEKTYRGVLLGAGVWCSVDNVNVFNAVLYGFDVRYTSAGVGTSTSTTSTTFKNCYASLCGHSGFRIERGAYCSFVSCASDSNTQYGYVVENGLGHSFFACGAEENGTAGVLIDSATGTLWNGYITYGIATGTKHGIVLDQAVNTTIHGGAMNAVTASGGNGIHVSVNGGNVTCIGTAFLGNFVGNETNSVYKVLMLTAGNGLVGNKNKWAIGAVQQPETDSTFAVSGYLDSASNYTFKINGFHTAANGTRNAAQFTQAVTDNTAVTYPLVIGSFIANASKGAASTITRSAGAYIVQQTQGGTANANLMIDAGSSTVPAGTWSIYNDSTRENLFKGPIRWNTSGPLDTFGAGTPEGAVTAPVGSTYRRTDGGAGTSFYVKESGTGNTGWVGK